MRSIFSSTLPLLRDKLIDNSFVSHPLFRAIEASGNLVKISGGSRIEQPVIFGEHSSLSVLSNGFEPVSMAVTDPFYTANFEWANFTQPIVLSAVEKAANKGDDAIVNILEGKMKNVLLGMKKAVNQQVMVGTGAVSTLQTLNGNGTSTSAPVTTGWFEALASTAQTNTVGGLSKTTYRSKNWFNQWYDSAGSFALSHLDELFINCQTYHPAGKTPDIILMSPKCFGAFQALQQSSVQYVSASDRESLDRDMVAMWRGAKIYVDPNLGFTSAGGAPVSAYVLSSDLFQLYTDTDGWFHVSDLMPVPGTATEAAMVFCRMQLVTGHLASHGILTDAEA